jgi:hypothetical protein
MAVLVSHLTLLPFTRCSINPGEASVIPRHRDKLSTKWEQILVNTGRRQP